jgi:hypothetical protein
VCMKALARLIVPRQVCDISAWFLRIRKQNIKQAWQKGREEHFTRLFKT